MVLHMLKGFNNDVTIKGKQYHVQTEDWGDANPFLVSRVYCNGAVIKTIKTPYAQALNGGAVSQQEALRQALRRQHFAVMDEVSRLPSE